MRSRHPRTTRDRSGPTCGYSPERPVQLGTTRCAGARGFARTRLRVASVQSDASEPDPAEREGGAPPEGHTTRPEFHTLPVVAWILGVAALAVGIAALADSPTWAVTVFLIELIAGLLIRSGYYSRARWRRTSLLVAGLVLVATGLVAVAASGATTSSGAETERQSPASPSNTDPSQTLASSSPALTATTSATAPSTSSPVATDTAPLPPPEEQVINVGRVGEFFGGAVIVGVESVFSGFAGLNVTTDTESCPHSIYNVGERGVQAGRMGRQDTFFRLTLLATEPDASITIRVEQLSPSDYPSVASCI